MGVHAPNLALIGDQRIDPLRPELLLYVPRTRRRVSARSGSSISRSCCSATRRQAMVAPWCRSGPVAIEL